MLKRLLSRDTKGKVAERAKTTLEASAAAVPDPAPIEPVSAAPAPAPTPAPMPPIARKTKSMRDSDVKDEFGRSAEQLAAEAAKEFDIMGVAARAAGMDERPDRPRKSETTDATSTGEFGVIGASPKPAAVPAVQAAAPVVETVVETVEVAAPSKLSLQDGHILFPAPNPSALEATFDTRDAYWNKVGVSDAELFGYAVCPELKGAPAWPTQRQSFRIVRTENSLIIASEGLSDPFAAFRGPTDVNGFGLEVFIELHQWNKTDADRLRAGWAYKAIEQFARLCAHGDNMLDVLDEHGVLSLDLPSNCVPPEWIVEGIAEPAGALINLPVPPGRSEMTQAPLSPIRVVPLTLIFPEELEDCVVGGVNERRGLANDLLTTGYGHKTDPKRSSLR